jgi:FAD/FMN-containing dehydrogenase
MTISPTSLEEASEAVASAAKSARQILPSGLNSSRQQPPQGRGAVMLSSRGLAKVTSLEPDNLLAVVEAGMTAAEVEEALAPTGLYWPVTGPFEHTLGAIMNEGLLGVETMARGTMCDWILGATMIDAAGRIVSSGGRTLKNVSGYDLTRLAWRSRGALVFSAAYILKLIPKPKSFPALSWRMDSPGAAASLAERVILAKTRPEALRITGEPGRVKLVAWLCGFPEMVAHQEAALGSLLGRPDSRREDGFEYFRDHFKRWSWRDQELTLRQGSRRAIFDFLRKLHIPSEPPDSWKFDIDLGGGRALLGSALEQASHPLALAKGLPDPDNLVRRLKTAIDPNNVFLPLSPERFQA